MYLVSNMLHSTSIKFVTNIDAHKPAQDRHESAVVMVTRLPDSAGDFITSTDRCLAAGMMNFGQPI